MKGRADIDAGEREETRVDEQAALRRVATLVAEGATSDELFAAAVDEAARTLDVPTAMLARYEPDWTITVLAALNEAGLAAGSNWRLDGPSLAATVLDTGRASRIDDYNELPGSIAAAVRASAVRSAVGAPIVVDGVVWGVMTVGAQAGEPLPSETEDRLTNFAELVGLAISNAESRVQLRRVVDEQVALREVATLVAEGATMTRLCAAVLEEIVEVLSVPAARLLRYEPDGSVRVLASLNDPGFPVDSRWPLDGPSLAAMVIETGRSARIDDYTELESTIAARARESGFVEALGVPITVDNAVWGVIVVSSTVSGALSRDTEGHLADFTELIAIAIANAESRDRLLRLADQQAALRRVATLVVAGATLAELGSAVIREVVQVVGAPAAWLLRYEPGRSLTVVAVLNDAAFPVGSRWSLDGSSVSSIVFDSGRPARIDDYSDLEGPIAQRTRDSGFVSSLGVPILVEGAVWGGICVGTTAAEPLPPDTESRLADFTDLMATAISNASSRDSLHRLAVEQAALHRVAALVARTAPTDEIFAALADEVAGLFRLPVIEMVRYEPDGVTATILGATGEHSFAAGTHWALGTPSILDLVHRTGEPARIDDYSELPGAIAEAAREAGFVSAIGAPILVRGAIWGAVVAVSTTPDPIPEGSEGRLSLFTDLVATAVSNVQARDDLRGLAGEQAALRRVATLVAGGATADELFLAVATEVTEVLHVSRALLDRYEADGTAVTLAMADHPGWDVVPTIAYRGRRWPLDPGSLTAVVYETRRPARVDDYSTLKGEGGAAARAGGAGSGCAAPIMVNGNLWGLIRVHTRKGEMLGPDAEARLLNFTELVAAAISNAQARDDLHELAAEQAALRRVATLVAEGTESSSVFDAVCEESGRLLGAVAVNLSHYTPDGLNLTMAGWSLGGMHVPLGTRLPLTPDTVGGEIMRTHAPARVDSWEGAPSEMARLVRERGVRSSLGAPIVVEGRLWGALVAATDRDDPLPAGTELRLARFTELVAAAIANATARSELIASRARIVAAGDEARRRIERNLHDGTQQRLLALGLDVQRIRASVTPRDDQLRDGLERVEHDLESVLEDLRELSRGLHPPMLARRGLRPSLRALGRRSPIPVDVQIDLDERLPDQLETAVYYAVSEGLTNAIKHSNASEITVRVVTDHPGGPFAIRLDGSRSVVNVYVTISDDGDGGAEPSRGSGLTGLVDRIDALGGMLGLDSPPGGGTTIAIVLPLTPPAALPTGG